MSAIRPHSKRLCRRSSSVGIWRGGQSLEITICFCVSWRALKMWKNSSWVRSLPAMNWMSSTSSTSTWPVLLPEGRQAVEPDGVDHLVDEAIGRDVEEVQLAVARLDVVADGVHQVRLAESHAAIEEERVVRLRRDLGDRARRGVGELVRGADDEALEGVFRVQGRGTGRDLGQCGLGRGRRARLVGLGDEGDLDVGAFELGERLGDHPEVVAGEPLAELGVRDPDLQRRAAAVPGTAWVGTRCRSCEG